MVIFRLPKEGPVMLLDQPRKCWVCKKEIVLGTQVYYRRPDTRLARHVCCSPIPVKQTITLAPTEEQARQIPRSRSIFTASCRRHGRLPLDC